MLQRWLDVNTIGKLTRTETFITLPSFSENVTWKGYSELVASFNVEAPNNFSFIGGTMEPSILPNYLLAVSWHDDYGQMHRYAMWKGVSEVLLFDIPLYESQLIKKNFRFEIWSTGVYIPPIITTNIPVTGGETNIEIIGVG